MTLTGSGSRYYMLLFLYCFAFLFLVATILFSAPVAGLWFSLIDYLSDFLSVSEKVSGNRYGWLFSFKEF